MHVTEIGPALVDAADGVVGVYVAVWVLGPSDHVDGFFDVEHHLVVLVGHEKIAGRLGDFVDVGIPEWMDLDGVSGFPFQTVPVAQGLLGFDDCGNRLLSGAFLHRRPERGSDLDIADGTLLEGHVASGYVFGSR